MTHVNNIFSRFASNILTYHPIIEPPLSSEQQQRNLVNFGKQPIVWIFLFSGTNEMFNCFITRKCYHLIHLITWSTRIGCVRTIKTETVKIDVKWLNFKCFFLNFLFFNKFSVRITKNASNLKAFLVLEKVSQKRCAEEKLCQCFVIKNCHDAINCINL